MADVVITAQDLTDADLDITRTAISTGNTYQITIPPGGVVLNIVKTGAGNANITITTYKTVNGLAVADRTFQVDATTGDVVLIIKDRDVYGNSSGQAELVTDEGTGITVAALKGLS